MKTMVIVLGTPNHVYRKFTLYQKVSASGVVYYRVRLAWFNKAGNVIAAQHLPNMFPSTYATLIGAYAYNSGLLVAGEVPL